MILYITRKFPPSVGGMQRFNLKLSQHLDAITSIKLISWGGSQAILPFFIIYTFFMSLWYCIKYPIKCIYVSDGLLSPLGYLLKIMTRKPVIANIHGRDIAFEFKPYQIIIPWALRRMNKVICVSNELKKSCMDRSIPEDILDVIPNGIDPEDFGDPDHLLSKDIFLKKLNIEQTDKKILLTVGRLIPKKGIDSFIKNILPLIIKEEPNVIYLVAGDGPLMPQIKDLIAECQLEKHVYMLGQISMDDHLLASVYYHADIFIMPNVPVKDDMEGFGIVAIEAGASGVPVVASKVDGITEAVIENKNGFLIDHGQYGQFAETTLTFLKDNAYRSKFGKEAKEFVVKQYAWRNIAKKYLTEFENTSK